MKLSIEVKFYSLKMQQRLYTLLGSTYSTEQLARVPTG